MTMFRLGRHSMNYANDGTTGHDRFQRPSRNKFRKRLNAHRRRRSTSEEPPPAEVSIQSQLSVIPTPLPSLCPAIAVPGHWMRNRWAENRTKSSSLDDLTRPLHHAAAANAMGCCPSTSSNSSPSSSSFVLSVRNPRRSSWRKKLLEGSTSSTPPGCSRHASVRSDSLAAFMSKLNLSGSSSRKYIHQPLKQRSKNPLKDKMSPPLTRKRSDFSRDLLPLPPFSMDLRHYSRYDYTALEDDQSIQEKLELEKKVQRNLARESAFLTCQYYLKNSGRYVLLEQLGDIGSRLDKFWFLVRDTTLKTERLLTMVPQLPNSPVNFSATNKKTLTELFLGLQHPYIYPVLDVDVKMLAEEEYVMVILPFNLKGSLKDLIYKSRCQDEWQDKYHNPNAGLPIPQIQRLGRQILEALLFLQDRGFPSFGHLHSGNVIVQNGVSRLTGYENTLLGYTSRLFPTIKKKLVDNREAIDVISFGHVLFEMCVGYELSTAHPTARHFEEVQQYPQVVEVLSFIFDQEDGHYPTVEEISLLEFFRNMDLREMRSMPVPPLFQVNLSPLVNNLLNDVRRYQNSKRYIHQDELYRDDQKYDGDSREEDDNNYYDDSSSKNNGITNEYVDNSEDEAEEGSSFIVDSLSSEYFEKITNKRFRSASLFENHVRLEQRSSSPAEIKSTKLKKRRSNSTSTMVDGFENATTALLSCPSSESSLAATPFSSIADVPSHNTLLPTPSEEFHTPPNTPLVSKSIVEDPAPFVAILTPSLPPLQTPLGPDEFQFHTSVNKTHAHNEDPKV